MNQICIALDLEATGLDRDGDAIIEVAAVKFDGQRELGTYQSFVNPSRELPAHIVRLTGINQTDVQSAPPLAVVLGELAEFIGEHPLVGQNLAFDVGFLTRAGLELPNPQYDTFELASILLPRAPSRSLNALVKHLGVEEEPTHRALADARAAGEVFLALLGRIDSLSRESLVEIVSITEDRDWALRPFFLDKLGYQETSILRGTFPESEDDFVRSLRSVFQPEPLESQYEARPLDPAEIRAAFEPGGYFSQIIPGFEHRSQQVEMAEAVARAINDDEHLMVEAGTGTGKSLAYLLPALLFAAQNGARVVVSTNTINLQEQLINKDIPDALEALAKIPVHGAGSRTVPDEIAGGAKVVVLKGRSNYLCLRRWASLRRNPNLDPAELSLLLKVAAWLPTSVSGDRAELGLSRDEPAVWSRISAQADSCLGAPCTYREAGKCFLHRARRHAEAAHMVVINHALLLSDISMGGQILPEYEHLVIDEAHHLEDEATEQFGFQLLERTIIDHLRLILDREGGSNTGGLLPELTGSLRRSSMTPEAFRRIDETQNQLRDDIGRCREQAVTFFDILCSFMREYSADSGAYDRQLRLTSGIRTQPDWSKVDIDADNVVLSLRRVGEGLTRLQSIIELESQSSIQNRDELLVELTSLNSQTSQLGQQIAQAINTPDQSMIYWVTLSGLSNTASLNAAPLEVAPVLELSLFGAKNCVILTSATMTSEDSFDYLRQRLGLSWGRELALSSPFDYARSTLICLPSDMPEPSHADYKQTLAESLATLGQATDGRTLALFTSHAAIRFVHGAIWRKLEESGIAVLGQGIDGSAKQLLAAFRDNPRAVLLGAASFWEGVDVVGEALSVLVITRIPFSVPTDPVFSARSETFEDPFLQYALPLAILRFKQGFGRLIRSRNDRGVVVVLDKRVQSRRYGSAFIDSLPACSVHQGPIRDLPERVAEWLELE